MAVVINVKLFPGAIAAAQKMLDIAAKGVTPHEASMGIHEEDGTKAKQWYDGREQVETLAEIMTLHEFGDAGVPERSFLRAWFDQHMFVLANSALDAMHKEANGDKDAIRRWVKQVHRDWIDWIRGGHLKPLAPITIATKAKYGLSSPSEPLIATEQFLHALKAKLDGRPV